VIEVRPVAGPDELRAAMALRHAAFVVEQGVPLADELDGRDDEAEHLVAVDGGTVVGTCRLLHAGGVTKLGRMAVAPAARGRGIAGALLADAERAARAAGSHTVVLDAQTGALGLYERAGYAGEGEVFDDAGIPHLTMRKVLAER
jgi:predicted GNAT family N-acyltransferase